MLRRLLVANRGEIAVRIQRACREAGISPVAVYSEADRSALHPSLADIALCIGPSPSSESYLQIGKLLDAARTAEADAIHPGYGFLSENPAFAQACEEAGITFVGPPAQVIERLGDKRRAKSLMEKAGVPVVPGYSGSDQSNERLQQEAAQIGAPLLIKAAAGGGGRGMRVVRDLETFPAQLEEARREARAAFGNDHLLLERYLTRPRHVEIQIFGDAQGSVVSLFERECSLQRRHQKIIEESPSPALTPELRQRMSAAAVLAGQTAGYVNAGTVEFLLEEPEEGDPRFYFLEVNTRLQVEHPVTEMRTGLDLVRLQFAVAEGRPWPLSQEEIRASGHAMEVRIYAEDASRGFLPSVGTLQQWIEPTGPGIRVDSGVIRGSEVSPYYDPLLAKLIVHSQDREQTLERMEQALCRFHILGVQTNLPYLLEIVRHPAFRAGETYTGFLNDHLADWRPKTEIPVDVLLALAAETLTYQETRSVLTAGNEADAYSPWHTPGAWRNS